MNIDSIQKIEEYLANIPKFQTQGTSAANFDLNRFREFCHLIGDPQDDFPSVHVAGTNGKGSTCQILSTVFQEAGYKAAVYTSPHIRHFNERFKINGSDISDERLVDFFKQYGGLFKDFKLTYFEISTAIAFWWFAQSQVDIAVIEVGLGGRLDATNVINPLLSVITSISLDHTNILGKNIAEIAREKGGIIKSGCPVAIGDLPAEAVDEIRKIAEQKASKVHTISNTRFIKPGLYELFISGKKTTIETNLAAPVQAKNIAMAWLAAELLKDTFAVTKEQFMEALRIVDLGPARFTKMVADKHWYFDGGHNVEAVRAMKQAVKTIGRVEKAILVIALMKDKLNPEVINEFSEFKKIYYYDLDFERAATFDDIKPWLPQVNPFPLNRDQLELFFKDFGSELVIFAGSFYFYTTVRDRIKNIL